MSDHELVLTERAEGDFRSILRYTVREWGEGQGTAYERQLVEAIRRVAQFPSMGVPRPDLGESVRVQSAEQHMIVYQVADGIVLILRLLHKRMSAADPLETESSGE